MSDVVTQPPEANLLPRDFPGGRLRRFRPADLEPFQAYRGITEVGRYQGWSPMPDAEAVAFIARMSVAPLFTPGEWIQLAVAEPGSDALIGDIGLHLSTDGLTAEVGMTLAPAAQGRGVATGAVREGVRLLFLGSDAGRVLGITDDRNRASIRLLERVGFKYQESRHVLFRGEPCSERIYVIERAAGRGQGW